MEQQQQQPPTQLEGEQQPEQQEQQPQEQEVAQPGEPEPLPLPTNDTSSSSSSIPASEGESLPPPTPLPHSPPTLDLGGAADGSAAASDLPQPLPPSRPPASSPPVPQPDAPSPQPEILSSQAVEVPTPQPMPDAASVMGAHSQQISLSAEDMEYNRLRTTYADGDASFGLEETINRLVTTTARLSLDVPTVASVSLFTTASAESVLPSEAEVRAAEEPYFEVVDGTTILMDEPPPSIIDSAPKQHTMATMAPDPSSIISPTMTQSEDMVPPVASSSAAPELESSSVHPEAPSAPEVSQTSSPPIVEESPQTLPPPPQEEGSKEGLGSPENASSLPMATIVADDEALLQQQQPIENSASPGEIGKEEGGEVPLDPQVSKEKEEAVVDQSDDNAKDDNVEEQDQGNASDPSIPEAVVKEEEEDASKQEEVTAKAKGRQPHDDYDYADYDEEEDEEKFPEEDDDDEGNADERKKLVQEQLEKQEGIEVAAEAEDKQVPEEQEQETAPGAEANDSAAIPEKETDSSQETPQEGSVLPTEVDPTEGTTESPGLEAEIPPPETESPLGVTEAPEPAATEAPEQGYPASEHEPSETPETTEEQDTFTTPQEPEQEEPEKNETEEEAEEDGFFASIFGSDDSGTEVPVTESQGEEATTEEAGQDNLSGVQDPTTTDSPDLQEATPDATPLQHSSEGPVPDAQTPPSELPQVPPGFSFDPTASSDVKFHDPNEFSGGLCRVVVFCPPFAPFSLYFFVILLRFPSFPVTCGDWSHLRRLILLHDT